MSFWEWTLIVGFILWMAHEPIVDAILWVLICIDKHSANKKQAAPPAPAAPNQCPVCHERLREHARHCHRCGRMTAEAHAALSVEESIKRIHAENRARENAERCNREMEEAVEWARKVYHKPTIDDYIGYAQCASPGTGRTVAIIR